MNLFAIFVSVLSLTCILCASEPPYELLEVVLKELKDVKQSLTSLEHSVETLKKENSELHYENKKLKTKEASEQHQMALSGKTKRQAIEQVAFTVGVSATDLKNLGLHQVIVFDRAVSNVGNAYHTHSGIFLAPVQGYYCFTLTVMVSPSMFTYVEIVKDGQPINDLHVASPVNSGRYISGTKQWIFEVNKGSEVWIRSNQADSEIHGGLHTLLSGFLLFQTE